MADAKDETHQVWWDGESQKWSCSCGSEYLVTDVDAERHYLVMRGLQRDADRPTEVD